MVKQQLNIQDAFLNKVRKEGVLVNVHVTNGYQIKAARVTGYDNFVVLIEAEGKQMMLYKHAISSVTASERVTLRAEAESGAVSYTHLTLPTTTRV